MTSYREAGVDLEGARRHVDSIADLVTATWGKQVVGGFGGFAAGVEIPREYENPVVMMSTDGVGTKLEIARQAGKWEGVGFDLVAMCVDDLAAVGAQPLGFVDYMAVGSLNPDRDTAIVSSIAKACHAAGCPLLGGETAEHPGVMESDAIDLAGAVVGISEKEDQLSPARVRAGHQILGLASPNLRSNGFSLVRSLFGSDLLDHADTLLSPSVIYSPAVLEAVATKRVAAAAHITGGGIIQNLERSLPAGLGAVIDTSAWERPDVFHLLASRGASEEDMVDTFNLGIGFCLIVEDEGVPEVLQAAAAHHPRVIGVVDTTPGVRLE